MGQDSTPDYFKQTILAHLDAAYNLARWLTGDAAAAEDLVQEASLRAFRSFHTLSGPNPKAWFMAIVRNLCVDWLRGHRQRDREQEYDDSLHGVIAADTDRTPEALAIRAAEARHLHAAIAALPLEFREAIVLREMEEMSYKEISAIIHVPIGTVMSRLSRGRDLLALSLRGVARQAAQ